MPPILGMLALTTISFIVEGFVLVVLWEWYMVSLFHLPTLTIPYAIGLGLIVYVLTSHPAYKSGKTTWKMVRGTAKALVGKAIIVLLVGYTARQFV